MKWTAFLFALFTILFSADADTISILRLEETGPQGAKKIKKSYWIPSSEEFDILINSVKKIVRFEKIKNPDDAVVKEEEKFLDSLIDWKEKKSLHLSKAQAGFELDKKIYAELEIILELAKSGDLLTLQRQLIDKFWRLHFDYGRSDLSFPIWSEKEASEFYARFAGTPAAAPKSQPTISHKKKAEQSQLPESGDTWNLADSTKNVTFIGY